MNPQISEVPGKTKLNLNHEPLYKRLPSRDEDGKFLSDFMMLIPGLRQDTQHGLKNCLDILHATLDESDDVVFADLNIPLNLLWVSVRSRPGITIVLSDSIRKLIPEARLIGHTMNGASEDDFNQQAEIEGPDKPVIGSTNSRC